MFERVILKALNGASKGHEFVLSNERDYVLGRATDCSCVLNDPYRLVSRRHCRIEVRAPFVRVQDLGSRNGTQVNGANIGRTLEQISLEDPTEMAYEPHLLEDGDILQIAGYEFEVECDPSIPCAEAEARDPENLWACECASCC